MTDPQNAEEIRRLQIHRLQLERERLLLERQGRQSAAPLADVTIAGGRVANPYPDGPQDGDVAALSPQVRELPPGARANAYTPPTPEQAELNRRASGGGGLARTAAQGLTWGFGDEIAAGVRTAAGEEYPAALADERAVISRARERHPGRSMASEVAGAVIPSALARRPAPGLGALPRLAQHAALGGVSGATYGLGAGEGLQGRLEGAGAGALTGGAFGAALPGLGAAGSRLRQRISRPEAGQVVDDFAALGAAPTAGQATGNRSIQLAERTAAELPASSGVMARRAVEQVDSLGQRLEELAERLGGARSRQDAGESLQGGARRFLNQGQERSNQLYRRVDELIPRESRASTQNALAAFDDLAGRFEGAPALGEALQSQTLNRWSQALRFDAAADGTIPYAALKSLRSEVGDRLARFDALPDASKRDLNRLYRALTQDMGAAAEATSPEAVAAWRAANSAHRRFRQRLEGSLERIVNAETPERALNFALNFRQDASRLRALRRDLPREDWENVAAFVLRDMGRARNGVQDATGEVFSPATFMTNWAALQRTGGAVGVLFGNTRHRDLPDALKSLVRAADSFKQSAALANHSGTARANYWTSLLTGGALAGGFSGGGVVGGTGMAALSMIAPYAASRLMTSPRFVRWMARGMRPNLTREARLRHMAGLQGVMMGDPTIRDEVIEFYRSAMESETPD